MSNRAAMDFTVTKTALAEFYKPDGGSVMTEDWCALVREDTDEIISVVSSAYQLVQNEVVFDLADELSKYGFEDENCMCLPNGTGVLSLKGPQYGDKDATYDRINLVHGFGTLSLSIVPSNFRMWCSNQMNMLFNRARGNKFVNIIHKGDINTKILEAHDVIREFGECGKTFRKHRAMLEAAPITTQMQRAFFLDVYRKIEDSTLVMEPKTEAEEKSYTKAIGIISNWQETYNEESQEFGNTAWVMANSVTKWVQHKTAQRGRKASAESLYFDNLSGNRARSSETAFRMAMEYAA